MDTEAHLESLKNNFGDYFDADVLPAEPQVRNPSTIPLLDTDDGDMAKDELMELKNNQKLRVQFDAVELSEFWCGLMKLSMF